MWSFELCKKNFGQDSNATLDQHLKNVLELVQNFYVLSQTCLKMKISHPNHEACAILQ